MGEITFLNFKEKALAGSTLLIAFFLFGISSSFGKSPLIYCASTTLDLQPLKNPLSMIPNDATDFWNPFSPIFNSPLINNVEVFGGNGSILVAEWEDHTEYLDSDKDGILDSLKSSIQNTDPNCETVPKLNFSNSPTLESGKKLAEGSVYRFPNITDDLDALVTIEKVVNGRISTLDQNSDDPEFFKPEIEFTTSKTIRRPYVDLRITIVKKGSNEPFALKELIASFIDVDGNNEYQEFNMFDTPVSYTYENPTEVEVNYTPGGLLINGGRKEYNGISNKNPSVNVEVKFEKISSFVFRFGIQTQTTKNFTTNVPRQSGIQFTCLKNFVDPQTIEFSEDVDDDGDGVTNEQEGKDGTDPLDPCDFVLEHQTVSPSAEWKAMDCDGDGVTNEKEKEDGTDPLDPCSYKPESVTLTPSKEWEGLDCDNDGNPNGTDPDPLVATARDDSGSTSALTEVTINILGNDDFLPNNDSNNLGTTSLSQIGGTAIGSVIMDAETGMLTYLPSELESNSIVTIVYEVCNIDPNPSVCASATVSIQVGANTIDAVDDNFNGDTSGGLIPDSNVLSNDTLNGIRVTSGQVILTSTPTDELTINNDGSISVTPGTLGGTYTIDYTICEAANLTNCDSAMVTVVVVEVGEDEKIEVNQLVTPNGDGKNDFLFIRGVRNAKNNSLQIFNRWGVAVYKGSGYNNQNNVFDGRSKGRSTITGTDYLPSGVYYYIFQYENNQRNITDSGYIYVSQ